jgi:hypothetical protein
LCGGCGEQNDRHAGQSESRYWGHVSE